MDALLGSGTLSRYGYLNNEIGSIVTIGDKNGSGEFDGVVTNAVGSISIIKTGTGTETFTGNNSYSGSTLINSGTLKVVSNTGLGFGGQVYNTGTNEADGSVIVTGSSTLDLNGGITVDKAVTLNGGSLINSAIGTTTILDNGIASVTLSGTQVGNYSTPTLSATSAGSGTGATFASGSTVAPGGTNLYGAVATSGSGYTVTPGLAYTDSSGTGTGITATAVLSSLTLTGSNNFIGGNGNLTINAQISGTSGFTTAGAGILTLTGSNSYAGSTTVARGNLANNGYVTGVVNVNPNSGAPATLSGTGVFGGLVATAAASGANVAHIAPGVNTTGNFGIAGTLTFKNGLTIGNGTNLDYDLGSSSDLAAVTGALTLGNVVILNISELPGFSQGTYTLASYTGALTGDTSTWTVTGLPNDSSTLSTSTAGIVTITITGSNDSQLSISPSPISVGSVLVGHSTTGTIVNLSNADALNNGSRAIFASVATGSASVVPASGTVAANSSTTLAVGSGVIGGPSGNNIQIGTVAATNGSNTSGNAAPVQVTANVYQAFSGSTSSAINSGTSATLNLTTLANDDGPGGQRAGVTITGYNTGNGNFLTSISNGGLAGTASEGNNSATTAVGTVTALPTLLNGTYNYSGSVTGTAVYTDPALAAQAGVANQVWSGVSLTATVTGNSSNARTNVFSAQIMSGSSYAGYSLSSSVLVGGVQSHPDTGPGGTVTTTASLLGGIASASATVSMSFDSSPVSGPDNPFRASDILTLTGIAPVGTETEGPLAVTLTDTYVLQLSYDISAAGLEFIAQNTGVGWANAVTLNSTQTEALYANKSYATYLAGTTGGNTPALGAYGYFNGFAWAVLDHTSISDPVSEFAVVPEPGACAMIFAGFGMLFGFRKLRRRLKREKT